MAVELRLGEKRAGQAKDLVGPTKLLVLPLQRLDALFLRTGWAFPATSIPLVLANPAANRLSGATNLLCHRRDRRPLRLVLGYLLKDKLY
jgi:hypothetical protein